MQQRCARCGTLNDEASLSCASCGAVLVPPDDATPASRDPYAELATLGSGERAAEPYEAAHRDEPDPFEVARREERAEQREPAPAPAGRSTAPRAIPEWVLPGPPPAARDARAEIPGGRAVRFIVLLIAWIALFHALPPYTIYATSPGLREAIRAGGLNEYISPPSCEETAAALQQDPASCSDPAFADGFARATSALRSERNRNMALLGMWWGMLAVAFLVLVMGSGLRAWWWFGIFLTPLALFVEGWALWRLAAHPVRYWERR